MVNLAVQTQHAPLVQQHRDLLKVWIEDTAYRQEVHYAHPDARPRVRGQEYEW